MRERFESRLSTVGMSLAMDFSVDAARRPMKVDAAAMEHILFDLVDKAAKYASSGRSMRVTMGMVESDRWIEVADPGPGERRRISQAFHKSSHEAVETKPGVGLGLAPSRRLASSLGGELSGESSETVACFGSSTPAEKA